MFGHLDYVVVLVALVGFGCIDCFVDLADFDYIDRFGFVQRFVVDHKHFGLDLVLVIRQLLLNLKRHDV